MEESNPQPSFWRGMLYHLTNLPWLDKYSTKYPNEKQKNRLSGFLKLFFNGDCLGKKHSSEQDKLCLVFAVANTYSVKKSW